MTAQDGAERLTAADVARERGWTRQHAWRWLDTWRRRLGAKVVQREPSGRGRLFVTAAGLERIREAEQGATDPKVLRELAGLRELVADLTKRVDAQARELIEFRRQSREWFRRPPQQPPAHTGGRIAIERVDSSENDVTTASCAPPQTKNVA